jgi:hypothetical protein
MLAAAGRQPVTFMSEMAAASSGEKAIEFLVGVYSTNLV